MYTAEFGPVRGGAPNGVSAGPALADGSPRLPFVTFCQTVLQFVRARLPAQPATASEEATAAVLREAFGAVCRAWEVAFNSRK
jgi:hypothetical protein